MNSKNIGFLQDRFRLVSGGDSGESASYVFHSSEERVFKTYDDCIGCPPYEDGDTLLYRQFTSQMYAESMVHIDENSRWEETLVSEDEKSKRIIAVLKDNVGKVSHVRIIWIEPTDRAYAYWFIQAPTVAVAKAFERSQAFREIKKTMASEPPNCDTYGSNSANYDWCK